MKERPIIFNGEMVRAILGGRKTQARMPIKPQPVIDGLPMHFTDGVRFYGEETRFCPYGQPGDRLIITDDKGNELDISSSITDMRVERVQDISTEGIQREGFKGKWELETEPDSAFCFMGSAPGIRRQFAALWNSIYEKKGFGWDANPWVWVVEFEVGR